MDSTEKSPAELVTSSSSKMKDLPWALQIIEAASSNIQNISIYSSQGTSSSAFLETDKSLALTVSRGSGEQLCQVLRALGRGSRDLNTTPMNLALHGVNWEMKQLKSLCLLLDHNTSIKQLELQRNIFPEEGLRQLSATVGRNKGLRAIIIWDCQLESFGTKCLAFALAENDTLEELQIWEDSIGSGGAEELSKMIEANSALKLLLLHDKDSFTATPLISAVLARSRTMEVHIWSRDNDERGSKVVEFTPESSTLMIYKLDTSSSRRVAGALAWNTTVKSLDMTGIRLRSRWAKEFRGVLENNRTLKEVILSRTSLRDKSIVYIAASLFKNNALESLRLDGNWFGGIGLEHLLCPISRFSAFQTQANATLKSLTFGGGKLKIGRRAFLAILQFLETNQTVAQLGIYDDSSLKPDDFVKLFRSLERNATLRFLHLRNCRGVAGELVVQTIMEILLVNPWIEQIDLSGTPLQIAGKTDKIYEKLGQNGSMVPEDLLVDLPLEAPTCCRVFICGQQSAGKSTLSNSISHNLSSSSSVYMDHLRSLIGTVEQMARTSEIKISNIDDGHTKISLWNLMGQHDNFALHDLMFPGPGSPSFFLIVSSLIQKSTNREVKRPEEIEDELLYWLRFIVSNSRRVKPQRLLPHVSVVLTHYDKASEALQDLHPILHCIKRPMESFQEFLVFYPTVFLVDARSSVSVSKLSHHLRKTSRTILQRVPQVYRLCSDLIQVLKQWRSENSNKPVMRWTEFCSLCQLRVPALRIWSRRDSTEKVNIRRRAVLKSLHDIGEIIFFEELGFVILDCNWFCSEVLSPLTKLNKGKINMVGGNGFISRQELEKILRSRMESQIPQSVGSNILDNMEAGDLVKMMLKLELCYEQNPGDPNTLLLIPSLLEEGKGRKQNWQVSNPSECNFVGRRLTCDDSRHTVFTSGFFPHLQVHLHNKIFKSRNQQAATYSLEKNLIYVMINGINCRVELAGQLGYFYLDVVACSTKNVTEILRLFRQLIIPTIQSLCPNIALTENIIRPDCIRYLILPRLIKTQLVPLQYLKQAMLSVPADSIYDYQHSWNPIYEGATLVLQSGFDYARYLLSDEDFREVLHRRYYDLHHLAVELAVPVDNAKDDQLSVVEEAQNTVEPSLSGIAKGTELVLQRLRIIEKEIKDLKQEIQGLRYYEHRILLELHRKVEYMVSYNIQLEERKIPHMFYFVQHSDAGRLVTRLFAGMSAVRLHLLCEFRGEMHVVEGQMGCPLMQVDGQVIRSLLPYLTTFMKLLTLALKIGAQFAAGIGEMIPDLSKEVAHLIDSSFLQGSAAAAATSAGAAGMLGTAAAIRGYSRYRNGRSSISEDMSAARQWLFEFLKSQGITSGREIADKFGLWRVRYLDSGQIAWICQRHKETRHHEIVDMPFI